MSASAQESFEKPRRLIDAELDALQRSILQRDVQRSFSFDPRQRADIQRAGQPASRLLRSAVKLATLNVENTRSTPSSDIPSRRSSGINVAVLRRGGRAETAVAAAMMPGTQRSAAGVGDWAETRDTFGDN